MKSLSQHINESFDSVNETSTNKYYVRGSNPTLVPFSKAIVDFLVSKGADKEAAIEFTKAKGWAVGGDYIKQGKNDFEASVLKSFKKSTYGKFVNEENDGNDEINEAKRTYPQWWVASMGKYMNIEDYKGHRLVAQQGKTQWQFFVDGEEVTNKGIKPILNKARKMAQEALVDYVDNNY